jgi:hypothetical protein
MRKNSPGWLLCKVAGLAVAVAAVLSPVPAMAQPPRGGGGGGMMMGMGGMGMGGQMDAPVTSEMLGRIGKIVNFDADQKLASDELLKGYLAGYQVKADEMRKVVEETREEFRESRDPTVWQGLAPKMEEFRKYRDQSEQSFMNDLKSILTEPQLEKWPAVDRMLRRDTLSRSFMAGERLNLITMLEQMKLPEDKQKALKETLDQYELELDRELIERNKLQTEVMGGMQNFFRVQGDPDAMAKAEELVNKNREASMRVRDVHRKYARLVESMLEGEQAAKFNDAVKRESFPEVYRERYGDRVVAAAIAMSEIDQSQRDALTALLESHQRETQQINSKHEQAIAEREKNFSISGMMGRMGGMGGPDQALMEEVRTARRTLEESTITKVKAILTPEQAEKLPSREDRGGGNDRGNRGMRDGGGNEQNNGERPRRRNREGTPATPANPAAPATPASR